MRRLAALLCTTLLLIVACGRMTLPASTVNGHRTLAGNWTIEFGLDSLRGSANSGSWIVDRGSYDLRFTTHDPRSTIHDRW